MTTEREFWDSVAGDRPETMIREGDWEAGIAADLAQLPAPLDERGPVLDLGCGIGRLTRAYAERYQVWTRGLDISPEMLDRAAQPFNAKTSFVTCDGRSISTGYDDKLTYAAAFSVQMFQHIPMKAQRDYVQQVAERLRPGARFTFQVVTGSEEEWMSHQVLPTQPPWWCEIAGLIVESSVEAVHPQWLWTTARKPE